MEDRICKNIAIGFVVKAELNEMGGRLKRHRAAARWSGHTMINTPLEKKNVPDLLPKYSIYGAIYRTSPRKGRLPSQSKCAGVNENSVAIKNMYVNPYVLLVAYVFHPCAYRECAVPSQYAFM